MKRHSVEMLLFTPLLITIFIKKIRIFTITIITIIIKSFFFFIC